MLRARAATAAVLGLAGAFACGLGLGALSDRAGPQAVLSANYGTALADADTSWTSLPPNIWLSRLGGADSQTDRLLTTGDTITIEGKNGQPEVIRITSHEHIEGERLGLPGVRFQLVTGHTTGPGKREVRFMFATETPSALPVKAPANRVL